MTAEPPEALQSRTLAEFQSALLELLASSLPPDALLHRLHTDPAFLPYHDYVATFELRMIEVAAQLTRQWGRREAGIPTLDTLPDLPGSLDA